MKHILITGANSYIGVNVEAYLAKWPDKYQVDTVDMIGDGWKNTDFSGYDTIFHVAGIAHVKETKENEHLYYEVNEKLAVETAKKAKEAGVGHFIILSTMSVYGLSNGVITKDTKESPKTHYGKAKYNADVAINELNCDTFKVSILRPPMVYGEGCKGNYQTLRKFALKTPVFPKYKNERSMVYVGNLAAFVKGLIDSGEAGLFFPQDAEYVCTSDMVALVAACHGKRLWLLGGFGWAVECMLLMKVNVFTKVFGSLRYGKTDLIDEFSLKEAIELMEK